MRKYAFRKMTRDDFAARVRRVDPEFHSGAGRCPAKRVKERPFLCMFGGFVLAYVVISVARNRDYLEESLRQGSLPAHMHGYVIGLLAAFLAFAFVAVLYHLGRWITRRGAEKRNSGGLLAGAVAAGALVYTPASVFEAGYGMLDPNSRKVLQSATSTVKGNLPGVDLASIVFVSSQEK